MADFWQIHSHWNDIGQFYAVRAIVVELERQLDREIGRLELAKVNVDTKSYGDEGDAARLLNLPTYLTQDNPHAVFQVVERALP